MDAIANVVLPVFGIILAGYLAGRFGVLGPASAEALNRFVFYFALPPLLFIATARVPTEEILRWDFLGAYVCGSLLTAALAAIGAWTLFGHRKTEFITMHAFTAVFSNTGYLGIPLFLAAFGPDHILPAVVVTVATNVFLAGAAIALVEGAQHRDKPLPAVIARGGYAIVKSPLLIAPAAGLAASFVGLPLPEPVVRFCDLLGATAGPGALFALGLSLLGSRLTDQVGELAWLVAMKLFVHPALTWLFVVAVFTVGAEWSYAAVILAALPTGALVYVIAEGYGVYVQRSSAAILVSTVVSTLTLSILFAFA